jgi:hypothetical protein
MRMSTLPSRPNQDPAAEKIPYAITPQAVRAGSFLSAILTLVLTVEVVSMGWYGYDRIQTALEPENLADRIEDILRSHYPEVRQELVAQVQNEAPTIANQVSEEILRSTPDARVHLELFTARQLEQGLDQVTELSAEQFRDLLHSNRDRIENAFVQLEQAPAEAREIVLDAEASIEEQLGVDLRDQARQGLELYRQFNDKLDRLSTPGVELDRQEMLERRMVRIMRALGEQAATTRQLTALR